MLNMYALDAIFNGDTPVCTVSLCFSEESWGPWQQWSLCSVSCGEGVRERMRECLLPSGVGGLRCTGMVKEQSICSLEDCVGQCPPFSCFSRFVLQYSEFASVLL